MDLLDRGETSLSVDELVRDRLAHRLGIREFSVTSEVARQRRVRGATVADMRVAATTPMNGTLLVTAGPVRAGDETAIDKLASTGCAAILATAVPDRDAIGGLLRRAYESDLAVLIDPTGREPFDLSHEINQIISTIPIAEYERAGRDANMFVSLVLRGANLRRILHQAANTFENPIVLEDAAHQVIDYASFSSRLDDVLANWNTHSRADHGSISDCQVTPVTVREELRGRLHVLAADRPQQRYDALRLEGVAAAVGVLMLDDLQAVRLAEQGREALVADVLRGAYSSEDELLQRASALGAPLADRQLLSTAVVTTGEHGRGARAPISPESGTALLREIQASYAAAGVSALSTDDRGMVVSILGVPSGRSHRRTVQEVAASVATQLVRDHPNRTLVLGASDVVSPGELPSAVEQAVEACRFGLVSDGLSGVVWFGELGLSSLLLRLADTAELPRFVESQLANLLKQEAQGSGAPLLETLRAYLAAGGNKTETARALHLERRSLYHRLERLTALTGHDLDDPEVRLNLAVALRGLDMLRLSRE